MENADFPPNRNWKYSNSHSYPLRKVYLRCAIWSKNRHDHSFGALWRQQAVLSPGETGCPLPGLGGFPSGIGSVVEGSGTWGHNQLRSNLDKILNGFNSLFHVYLHHK